MILLALSTVSGSRAVESTVFSQGRYGYRSAEDFAHSSNTAGFDDSPEQVQEILLLHISYGKHLHVNMYRLAEMYYRSLRFITIRYLQHKQKIIQELAEVLLIR